MHKYNFKRNLKSLEDRSSMTFILLYNAKLFHIQNSFLVTLPFKCIATKTIAIHEQRNKNLHPRHLYIIQNWSRCWSEGKLNCKFVTSLQTIELVYSFWHFTFDKNQNTHDFIKLSAWVNSIHVWGRRIQRELLWNLPCVLNSFTL